MDNNLKEQLSLLVELQSADLDIYSLGQEKDAVPLKLKELEKEFEKKKENLAELDKKSQLLQRQRKEKELELGSKEEERKKMQSQLYQLKTNKEYEAKLKEIESAKADASVLEDAILGLFEEFDKLNIEIKKEKEVLAQEEKNSAVHKQELAASAKEIEQKLKQIQIERDRISEEIEPKILTIYNKITLFSINITRECHNL